MLWKGLHKHIKVNIQQQLKKQCRLHVVSWDSPRLLDCCAVSAQMLVRYHLLRERFHYFQHLNSGFFWGGAHFE